MCFGTTHQEPSAGTFHLRSFPVSPEAAAGSSCPVLPTVTSSFPQHCSAAAGPRRPRLSEEGLGAAVSPGAHGRVNGSAARQWPRGKSGPQAAVLPQAGLARRAAPGEGGRGVGAEQRRGGAGSPGPTRGDAPRADYTSQRAPRAVAARGMPGARQHRGVHDLPLPPAQQRPRVSRWAGLSLSCRAERHPQHPISAGFSAAVANERRGGRAPATAGGSGSGGSRSAAVGGRGFSVEGR